MRTIIILALSLLPFSGIAQFYPLEAGLAGGYTSGLNFRAYLEEELSYEALLSFRLDGLQTHLFRQNHIEVEMTKSGSINFVFGYGAHLGFYFTDNYSVFFQDIYFGKKIFTPVVGVDGYAGLEYRFYDIPLSIGLNYKPYMELSLKQIFGVNIWDFGVTVKYRFNSQNSYY